MLTQHVCIYHYFCLQVSWRAAFTEGLQQSDIRARPLLLDAH